MVTRSSSALGVDFSIFCCFSLQTQYVLNENLAEVMFRSIDTDDFLGDCYSKPYPLLAAANETLNNV